MLNNITVQGRLVRDPELRHTQSGKAVASFTLACDQDRNRDNTDFIDVVVWEKRAEFVCKFFQKGSMAIATGRLQMRKYEDKDGNARTAYEILADNVYFGSAKKADD